MQTPVSNGFSPHAASGPQASLIRASLAHFGARAVMWILASSLGAVALGQETAPDDAPDTQDTSDEIAPERVARLSFTQGGVSLQAVGETAWGPATLNRPLTPGDFLQTENDGRAEVQVGEAAIRVGAGTNFAFLTLDDDALRMRLSSGVLNLRVRTLGENEVVEIETPQATTSILRPGTYRLEVDPNGNTTVLKVSSGMLEARGAADQSFVVRSQQAATLTGTQHLAFATATLGAPDTFDQWALERDRRDDYVLSSDSARHVPEDVVGYEDLDSYGSWSSEPDYGYVWTPTRVTAGWSPYTYGRYSYVSGWGWAWIDDAPWGFAPFHYGRWVTVGGRWSWVPGPRHGRPVGRPVGGTPVVGHPSGPRHGWHVPPPPRGVGTHAGPSSDGNSLGTRPSFTQNDRQWDDRNQWNGRNDGNANRGGAWRGGREIREGDESAGSSRFRTVPDGNGARDGNAPRYVRPGGPRNDQPGSATPVVPPVSAPPATSPPGNDRRMRIPQNEFPQNAGRTYSPRNDSRPAGVGGRYVVPTPATPRAEPPRAVAPRQETQRPIAPPQPQQSQPPQQRQQQQQQPGRNNGRRTLER